MRSTVAIIGIATASVIGLSLGTVMSPGGAALADPVNVDAIHAPQGAMPSSAGPDGDHAEGDGPGWHRRPDFFRLGLARHLATMETIVGIRSDQLDAWRDYTSALLALMEPPARGAMMADRDDPFGRPEHLADTVIAKADTATRLKAAIAALRQKLTPDQLVLLQQAEVRMGPHHGPQPFFGPGPQDQRSEPQAERPAPSAG
jgi:hypothetical protein